MSIVVNGSGTITGISTGGLPDGSVDVDTLAANSVTAAKIVDGTIVDAEVTSLAASKLTGALPAISAANLTSIPAANVTGTLPASVLDTTVIENNIAMLGFFRASDNSVSKYSLVDQVIDEYVDATGIDAGNSTNEVLASGSYSGSAAAIIDAYTTSTVEVARTGTHTGRRTGNAEILVVAGGGSGSGNQGRGGRSAGGGGAGGVVHHATYPIVSGVVYDWTVGEGGASSGNSGDNGGNSVWNINSEGSQSTMTANGGGRGGYNSQNGAQGGSGGGGGGGASGENYNQTSNGGGTGYGTQGGNSSHSGGDGSGGGGGAGGPAPNGSNSDTGTVGGVGKLFSTFVAYGTTSGNVASSGSNGGWFAGGGAGGSTTSTAVAGGVGGGGYGGHGGTQPGAAIPNTGGGSGGAGTDQSNRGSDGIILISYPALSQDLTLQSVATTAESAPTTGDIVMLIEDSAGTATINTDIKAYISRDGSAFSSQVTLTDEGDWGTNKRILAAHNVDISGITSGTSMKYKITTHNQSASKATKIHATSLAWA